MASWGGGPKASWLRIPDRERTQLPEREISEAAEFSSPTRSPADFTAGFRTGALGLCVGKRVRQRPGVSICVTCLWQSLCQEARASVTVQRYVAPHVWPAVLQV